jgi:plastocyanin
MAVDQRKPRVGRWGRGRGAAIAVATLAVGAVGLLLLLPLTASTRTAVRDITLVVRDMAFYLDGGSKPNPTIQVRTGETVQLTLLNRDPGLKHNLTIEALGLDMPYLKTDASMTVRLRAPSRPGRLPYVCAPHSEMMRGVIEVVGSR